MICGAAIYTGAVPTRIFGHDVFFLLDNGWRVVNGQRPHIDFTSPWGPVSFLVVGTGLLLSQNSVDGIGYGNAIFAFIAALWGYRLTRGSMGYLPRFLICTYLALLVVSPYPLGFGALNSSFAMLYNRYGYALLGLLMVEAFPRARTDRQGGEEVLGGLSSGAVAALTLFLKANYFAAALLLIGVSVLSGRHSKWRFIGLLLGFTLVAVAFLSYLDFDLAAIQRDFELAAGARSKSFSFSELAWKLGMNAPFLLFIILLCVQGSRALDDLGQKSRSLTIAVLGGCVFAADMLLLCSNQQNRELPLTTIFSFFVVTDVVAFYRNLPDVCEKDLRLRGRLTVLAGGVFFLVSLCLQFTGLAYGFIQKAQPSNLASVARFTEPRLRSLLLYDNEREPSNNGRNYVEYVNSGMHMLLQNSQPNETVLTMDMMNPFPYALGRMAPRGGIAAAAYNYTLSDTHRPSDDRYFGDTDIVMVPKHPASPHSLYDGYFRIYQPALNKRFRLAAESDMWLLYKRK